MQLLMTVHRGQMCFHNIYTVLKFMGGAPDLVTRTVTKLWGGWSPRSPPPPFLHLYAMKLRTPLTDEGVCASHIAFTLAGSGDTPVAENTRPKNVIDFNLGISILYFIFWTKCIFIAICSIGGSNLHFFVSFTSTWRKAHVYFVKFVQLRNLKSHLLGSICLLVNFRTCAVQIKRTRCAK